MTNLPFAFFRSNTLESHPHVAAIHRILAAALRAVDPYRAVHQAIRSSKTELEIAGKIIQRSEGANYYLVSLGKAALPMTAALLDALPDPPAAAVLVSKSLDFPDLAGRFNPGSVKIFQAGHPVPDQNSLAAGQAILELAAQVSARDTVSATDTVICLISGGGSSLVSLPLPGISLTDLQAMTHTLLACGASIDEINTLRKHLDQLKGGKLAQHLFPAQTISLILSDVMGDALDLIASGPTEPDPSTFVDAWSVVQRYQLESSLPPSIIHCLQQGLRAEPPENPKPTDPIFAHSISAILANNATAVQAAARQARDEKFVAQVLETPLTGEARRAGLQLAELLKNTPPLTGPSSPRCWIAGGETTVTLQGNGMGGRNQELALAAALALQDVPDTLLITLATDGGDGQSPAAGAVVDGATVARARALGMDAEAFLRNNDSYTFFSRLGDAFITGPTLTNVNDLALLFRF